MTITEQVIEPWKFPTALALGTLLLPERPAGWDEWLPGTKRSIRSGKGYEFQYFGIKDRHEYKNFIQWFTWGDVQVQVSAEVPEFDYDASATIRTDLSTVLSSFEPHDGSKMFTEEQVLAILEQRLDDRQSGVFARDEVIKARYEMTCNQIFTNLIHSAAHFGDGLWQMSAQTLDSTETWRVFEPTGSIVALDSNQSRC